MSIKDNFPSVEPSLSLNFARSKTLDPRITFSRTSVGTYTDGNGLIVTAAADEPRFDHKYENGVVKSLGLLVEESRTNLFEYSEDFTNADWTKFDVSISSNSIIAPDGSTNSYTITEGTSNSQHNITDTTTVTGTKTFSVYAKLASGSRLFRIVDFNATDGAVTGRFDLSNGTIDAGSDSSAVIKDCGNGWYRCSITTTTTVESNYYISLCQSDSTFTYTGDGSSSFYIFGAQVEAGGFPTSYIPTSGSTKTRVNDILSIEGTNFTDVYNQTEGSYKVEGFIDGTLPSNTYSGIFGAGGGSATSNFIFLNPSNSFGQYVCNTSQTPNSTLGKTYTNGAKFKIAASYLEADFACSFNGDISNSSTSGALYGSMTYFRIGGNPINGLTGGIKGAMRISNISYYPKQITDTQLQNLTK